MEKSPVQVSESKSGECKHLPISGEGVTALNMELLFAMFTKHKSPCVYTKRGLKPEQFEAASEADTVWNHCGSDQLFSFVYMTLVVFRECSDLKPLVNLAQIPIQFHFYTKQSLFWFQLDLFNQVRVNAALATKVMNWCDPTQWHIPSSVAHPQ